MERNERRWREAFQAVEGSFPSGGSDRRGGERFQVEGSYRWCRGRGGELSLVEGCDLRWLGAIVAQGCERSLRGAVSGGGERSLMEESDLRWRGVDRWGTGAILVMGTIAGGLGRGAIAGGGKPSLVERYVIPTRIYIFPSLTRRCGIPSLKDRDMTSQAGSASAGLYVAVPSHSQPFFGLAVATKALPRLSTLSSASPSYKHYSDNPAGHEAERLLRQGA